MIKQVYFVAGLGRGGGTWYFICLSHHAGVSNMLESVISASCWYQWNQHHAGISGTSIIAGISITLVSVVSASRWYQWYQHHAGISGISITPVSVVPASHWYQWYQHHTGIGIMLHQYYVWFPELGLSLTTWLCTPVLFGFCNNGLLCIYLGLVHQFSPRFSLVFRDWFDESTHVLYGCQSNIQHSTFSYVSTAW